MYDLKLTLHKHHFTQVCEFMEAFESLVFKLANNKALCSVETYENKAIIYVSTSQMNTNLLMRGVTSIDIERGNFDQYAGADLATLTNYYSEEHTTELMLSKLKNKRRFIEGTIMTTHKIEITRELLKQFDWDSKTYDERQVLIERLLPSVTNTQQYTEIYVVSGGCTQDIEEWNIESATIDELFGPDASDFW
jgi:glutamate synthase domain-containing protein 2